jgi:hypothetical protein
MSFLDEMRRRPLDPTKFGLEINFSIGWVARVCIQTRLPGLQRDRFHPGWQDL